MDVHNLKAVAVNWEAPATIKQSRHAHRNLDQSKAMSKWCSAKLIYNCADQGYGRYKYIYILIYDECIYIYIVYISLRLCGWLLALGSLNSIAQISQYSLVRLGSEEFTSAESWFLLFKRGKVLYWSFSIVPMTKPRQPIFKSHLGSLVRRKKSFSVDHFCGPSPESAGWGVESYPQAISQKSLGSYWEKGPFTSMKAR